MIYLKPPTLVAAFGCFVFFGTCALGCAFLAAAGAVVDGFF
jgi:hypothetical protein